jgi:hypothetical protein
VEVHLKALKLNKRQLKKKWLKVVVDKKEVKPVVETKGTS